MFDKYSKELLADLETRWQHAQASMRQAGADAMLVGANINLFYLSGRIFMGHIYLPVEGEPFFFVRRPAGLAGARVMGIRKPEQIVELLAAAGVTPPRRVLLEGDDLSHNEWLRLSALWPESEPMPGGSALLRRRRAVKTPYEVMVMKRTGARHAAVIGQYAALYERGMSDQEWSIEMFRQMLRAGSLGLFRIAGSSMEAFMGTVLAGDNGAAASPYDFALGGGGLHPSIPVGQSGVKLAPGMAVMVDIAANFYGYITDCTRVFSIGRLPSSAYEAHAVAIRIAAAVAAAGVPGASCEELYNLALAMAAEAGLADCFMGLEQKARFIGHGTGLVINELPVLGARSRDVLEEGMCIALEPKFVLPGIGAVGIEDTYLVTPQGMRNLTPCDTGIVELSV